MAKDPGPGVGESHSGPFAPSQQDVLASASTHKYDPGSRVTSQQYELPDVQEKYDAAAKAVAAQEGESDHRGIKA